MGKTRLVLVLALLCMAVACHEAHLDGSSEKAFNDSVMAMYKDHSYDDARVFGERVTRAESILGKEKVRASLNGMSWTEARAYLDQATPKFAPPASPDPAKS